MSVQAMAWALDHRQTGPLNAEARLVLVELADGCDHDGRGARKSAESIADRLGVTVRSVRRALVRLRDAGLIRPGDQQLVAHYRADRRPTVYDLALDGVQIVIRATGETVELGAEPYREDPHGVTEMTPREPVDNPAESTARGDSSDTPLPVDNPPRGDSGGRHGVTALSPNPRTKPTTPTHPSLLGDPSARDAEPVDGPPRLFARASAAFGGPALTQRECPGCGQPVYASHRCRRSALDPEHPAHTATPAAIAARKPPPPPPTPVGELLPFGVEHDPCGGCGTTDPNRPLVDLGLCARCLTSHYRTAPPL